MSSILNVGSRALMASQAALETTGHNIANVNTAGYSRQSVVLSTVPGQFTGGGYIGKGVELTSIRRTYDEFLTRQAMSAQAVQSGDQARADKLRLLESVFPGGENGLGAAVNDLMNGFSDVANAPTDLTARTVVLTRANELASRVRQAATQLDDLQLGIEQEMDNKVTAINTLAKNIADVNDRIARSQGNGQPPNDLLDQRDQFIRELNQYVQTTQVAATDGSLGVFIGGSQALVLGTEVATVARTRNDFNDALTSQLTLTRTGSSVNMDESMLGGGQVPGMLRFQNNDLREARNLLGRMSVSITNAINEQHKLGVDLNGAAGGNLFTAININTAGNVLANKANSGAATLALTIANLATDPPKFVASDYRVAFSGANSGSITRLSDGQVSAFAGLPATVDGLTISGTGNAGDSFMLKPFATSASNLNSLFTDPKLLAMSSSSVPAAVQPYDAANAQALMGLRDLKLFDGAIMTDGYSGLIAQVGVRAQSANYTASVSADVSATLEGERTAVSGVNLDEEAAKLLQYQQAYQASAKTIQVAQTVFDALLATVSR